MKQFKDSQATPEKIAEAIAGKKCLHIPKQNMIRDMEKSNYAPEKFGDKKFLFNFYEQKFMQPFDVIEVITYATTDEEGNVTPEKRELIWK